MPARVAVDSKMHIDSHSTVRQYVRYSGRPGTRQMDSTERSPATVHSSGGVQRVRHDHTIPSF